MKKVRLTVAEIQQLKDFNALADADELEIEIPAPVETYELDPDIPYEQPTEGVGAKITRWLRQW